MPICIFCYLKAMYSREPEVKGSQCAWTRSVILKPRHVLKGYFDFCFVSIYKWVHIK